MTGCPGEGTTIAGGMRVPVAVGDGAGGKGGRVTLLDAGIGGDGNRGRAGTGAKGGGVRVAIGVGSGAGGKGGRVTLLAGGRGFTPDEGKDNTTSTSGGACGVAAGKVGNLRSAS